MNMATMVSKKAKPTKSSRASAPAEIRDERGSDLATVEGLEAARATALRRAKSFVRSKEDAYAILRREGIVTPKGKLARRYA